MSQPPAPLEQMTPEERQQLQSYTPELRAKVMALSPEIRATLRRLHAKHTRHSETLTFRQMMQEVLADFQGVVAGIAVDNAAQAADSARRLADHRIPRGGLLPYFPLDKINNDSLAVLASMSKAVEGSALRLAKAADRGNMAEARRASPISPAAAWRVIKSSAASRGYRRTCGRMARGSAELARCESEAGSDE